MNQVLKVVTKHPTRPLVEEAFKVFTPDSENKALTLVVVDPLLALTEARIQAYKGNKPPDDPGSDWVPIDALTRAGIWRQLGKAEQLRTMQAAVDLLVLASKHADELAAAGRDIGAGRGAERAVG